MILQWFVFTLLPFFGRSLEEGKVVYDDEDKFLGPPISVAGDWYRLNNDNVTVSCFQALEICYEFGWQLVKINSESKNKLITYLLEVAEKEGPFWISASRTENETWQLSDGTPMSYFNWNEGQPDNEGGNEKCIQISNGGGWDDKSCEITLGFICEEQETGDDTTAS